mmetsp:Transcript_50135/g.157951  ORF Transcript_50135/g.157951 Transcript_50135/m.157951 type:complete len:468 (+) Transcript_50135:184-1587(+)
MPTVSPSGWQGGTPSSSSSSCSSSAVHRKQALAEGTVEDLAQEVHIQQGGQLQRLRFHVRRHGDLIRMLQRHDEGERLLKHLLRGQRRSHRHAASLGDGGLQQLGDEVEDTVLLRRLHSWQQRLVPPLLQALAQALLQSEHLLIEAFQAQDVSHAEGCLSRPHIRRMLASVGGPSVAALGLPGGGPGTVVLAVAAPSTAVGIGASTCSAGGGRRDDAQVAVRCVGGRLRRPGAGVRCRSPRLLLAVRPVQGHQAARQLQRRRDAGDGLVGGAADHGGGADEALVEHAHTLRQRRLLPSGFLLTDRTLHLPDHGLVRVADLVEVLGRGLAGLAGLGGDCSPLLQPRAGRCRLRPVPVLTQSLPGAVRDAGARLTDQAQVPRTAPQPYGALLREAEHLPEAGSPLLRRPRVREAPAEAQGQVSRSRHGRHGVPGLVSALDGALGWGAQLPGRLWPRVGTPLLRVVPLVF